MSALGVDRVCCLQRNLNPGGSARQWVHLLAHHVASGGQATILAPPGPLEETARDAGIEVVPTIWRGEGATGWRGVTAVAADHEAAIVHWDHEVMAAFGPALEASGRAALAMHQAPEASARWFGNEYLQHARAPIDHALRERGSLILVCGEAHRRRFESAPAFDVPPGRLRLLPASIPIPSGLFEPSPDEPREILALARLSPDKQPIQRLAIELARARFDAGGQVRLTIAGEGPCREEAIALCGRRLPPLRTASGSAECR